MIEGKQMHKSKGNFVTMKKVIEEYGADATRCALLLGAEGMDDPDWRTENVKDLQGKLESLYSFAVTLMESPKIEEDTHMEKWLMSSLQRRICEITENLEEMKTRTALEIAMFEVWNDFRWYLRRKGKMGGKAPNEALQIWLKLLAPFAPHVCEELWSQIHTKEFISLAPWPRVSERRIDLIAEEQENLIREVIEDTLNVVKATKTTPKRIYYYVAGQWKSKVYVRILEESARREAKLNELMKELFAHEDLKEHSKELAKFASRMLKYVSGIPTERRQTLLKIRMLDEKAMLAGAIGFLGERFNAEVTVFDEEDKQRYDPKQRAVMSMPFRPAIYIE
jgi:leucyl-tRNA synthetase